MTTTRRNGRARLLAVAALAAGALAVLAITGALESASDEADPPPRQPTVERRELLDRNAERAP